MPAIDRSISECRTSVRRTTRRQVLQKSSFFNGRFFIFYWRRIEASSFPNQESWIFDIVSSFQSKNLHFPCKNLHFLLKNLHFLTQGLDRRTCSVWTMTTSSTQQKYLKMIQMMDSSLKTMNFALKVMDFAPNRKGISPVSSTIVASPTATLRSSRWRTSQRLCVASIRNDSSKENDEWFDWLKHLWMSRWSTQSGIWTRARRSLTITNSRSVSARSRMVDLFLKNLTCFWKTWPPAVADGCALLQLQITHFVFKIMEICIKWWISQRTSRSRACVAQPNAASSSIENRLLFWECSSLIENSLLY